jgi:hypothetical protein
VIGGWLAPAFSAPAAVRVQVRVGRSQLQPVPLMAVRVMPAGGVSTTVTLVLAPAFRLLLLVTVIVYAAPACPWKKLPE